MCFYPQNFVSEDTCKNADAYINPQFFSAQEQLLYHLVNYCYKQVFSPKSRKKKIGGDLSCPFREKCKTHTLIPKNDVTEPVTLITG